MTLRETLTRVAPELRVIHIQCAYRHMGVTLVSWLALVITTGAPVLDQLAMTIMYQRELLYRYRALPLCFM
jgi:hypothetical protein